jgi:hypothetical protein
MTAPKEITPNPISIKSLPQKLPGKEIAPAQGILDLGIECQTEIQGIGMGLLRNLGKRGPVSKKAPPFPAGPNAGRQGRGGYCGR